MNKTAAFVQPLHYNMLSKFYIPENTKTAAHLDQERLEKLPDASFGLILMKQGETESRLFPIFDRASTRASGKYLSEAWPGMPKVAAASVAKSVLGAAELFGIDVPESLRKVAALLSPNEKLSRYFEFSESDSIFGYQEKEEKTASSAAITINGQVMPISNPTELNLSEEWFGRNHNGLDYADQYKLANFIFSRRSDLLDEQTKLANYVFECPTVTKYANLNGWHPAFTDNMLKRAELASRNKNYNIASAFVGAASNKEAMFLSGKEAVINIVHELDKEAGITDYYDHEISDPISASLAHIPNDLEKKFAEDGEELREYSSAPVDEDWREDPFHMGKAVTVGEVKRAAESGRLAKILNNHLSAQLATHPMQTYERLPEPVRRLIVREIRKKF